MADPDGGETVARLVCTNGLCEDDVEQPDEVDDLEWAKEEDVDARRAGGVPPPVDQPTKQARRSLGLPGRSGIRCLILLEFVFNPIPVLAGFQLGPAG